MGEKGFQLFPEAASSIAGQVDALYAYMVLVSAFFTLLIAFLVVFLAIKYRRKNDIIPKPVDEHSVGGMVLEIVWSIIPLGLSLIMFAWGASIFFTESRPPADAMEIFVVGKQWMWKVQHNEGAREINELHIPVNRDIRLTLTSEDVIHDFAVPAFRTKTDVLPGRYTTEWFRPTKVGQYHLFCMEYCGTKHSGMIGTVYVMNEADYDAWLGAGSGEGSVPGAAFEEHLMQIAFELANDLADRGLGAVQPLGGTGEAFFFGYCEKGLEMMNIHKAGAPTFSAYCTTISRFYRFKKNNKFDLWLQIRENKDISEG